MAIIQVHVPKTGGSALWRALRAFGVQRFGHSQPIPQEPGTDQFIVTIRDPVARFVSAHSQIMAAHIPLPSPEWADVEVMAREYRGENQWPQPWPAQAVYEPQVAWVYSAARLREPDILAVLRTETLDEDYAALRERMGWDRSVSLPRRGDRYRNASDGPQRQQPVAPRTLSDEAAAIVRRVFAEDVAMVESLRLSP